MRRALFPGSVLVVISIWAVARFAALAESPPGFVLDEASDALHFICLKQTGVDPSGGRWPLFAPQLEAPHQEAFRAGVLPPTYLYSGVAWVSVFGHSIAAVRAMNAFYLTVTVVGVFLFAGTLYGRTAALFAALCASMSPWLFHPGRLATMVPLAPAFLVFGCWFLVRQRQRWIDPLAAGLCFALAMYSYPPMLVAAPLVALALLWLRLPRPLTSRRALETASLFFVATVVVSIPLIAEWFAHGSDRAGYVGIFSDGYLEHVGRERGSLLFYVKAWVSNAALYVSPDFLLISGDHNPRHSTQLFGVWSWLETAAVVGGAICVLRQRRRGEVVAGRTLGALIACYCAGVLPATLTWEGSPHALRSVGAAPFLAVISGVLLAMMCTEWPRFRAAVPAIAIGFTTLFLFLYFTVYPSRSRAAWEPELRESAEYGRTTGNWSRFEQFAIQTPRLVSRYFLIEYANETCESSDERATAIARRMIRD